MMSSTVDGRNTVAIRSIATGLTTCLGHHAQLRKCAYHLIVGTCDAAQVKSVVAKIALITHVGVVSPPMQKEDAIYPS